MEQVEMDKKSENLSKIILSILCTIIVIFGTLLIIQNKKYNNSQNNLNNINNTNKLLVLKIQELKEENKKLKNNFRDDDSDNKSLVYLVKDDLKNFILENYKDTSKRVKLEILEEVFIQSEKYNINPILLFAVCSQESSMRPWIRHSFVKVTVPLDIYWKHSKKIDTQAIGLCGVIWEIWKFQLIKNNIAEVKSDLYDPRISVRAMAFILDFYSNQKLAKETNNEIESAITRYFGITKNTKYLDDINKFVGELTRSKIYNR